MLQKKTYTPEDDEANNVDGRAIRSERLRKRGKDDDHELQTVHALTSDNIGKHTKPKLANNGTSRGGQLDGIVRGRRHLSGARVVDDTQHDGQHRGSEDVVRVGEEADTGDDAGADMVPSERSLVNLGQSKTTALIQVACGGELVVPVCVGSITTRRLAKVGDGAGVLGVVSRTHRGGMGGYMSGRVEEEAQNLPSCQGRLPRCSSCREKREDDTGGRHGASSYFMHGEMS